MLRITVCGECRPYLPETQQSASCEANEMSSVHRGHLPFVDMYTD